MSGFVQIVSCNRENCPWHRVTDVGAMPWCDNPEAPDTRVARRMTEGVPEQCPVHTKGPYLMVVTYPEPRKQVPIIIESVREMLSDWRKLWISQLDKSL